MSMTGRRDFIGGAFALGALGGCRTGLLFGECPELTFGVVSDIHVTTPESVAAFERALLHFRACGVDAVMVPGDLTDWGLKSSLKIVADAWYRVFPNDRMPDGRKIEKLFCSGNHDFDGWAYGDMTMEMHALGYSEKERLVKLGFRKCWEEAFHEPWEPIRVRTVKGYDFVSCEWRRCERFGEWMKAHADRFRGDKPFFHFQHRPVFETTGDSYSAESDADKGGRNALAAFPNAIAITGHSHRSPNDERSIWQGEFTCISTPSMSYTCFEDGHENGDARRNGTAINAMQRMASRLEQSEAQGYLVSVYADRVVVGKLDFQHEETVSAGPDWVVPLPAAASRPYRFDVRARTLPAPEFPPGAVLSTFTRNTENRQGKWCIVMVCEFPSATMPGGLRVYDYEVRVKLMDGSTALVKRYFSPAFHKLPSDEPTVQKFYFDVAELPQATEYRIEVVPRNCFGTCGAPLVSAVRKGVAGLATHEPGGDETW